MGEKCFCFYPPWAWNNLRGLKLNPFVTFNEIKNITKNMVEKAKEKGVETLLSYFIAFCYLLLLFYI